jgi:hypothetical protein
MESALKRAASIGTTVSLITLSIACAQVQSQGFQERSEAPRLGGFGLSNEPGTLTGKERLGRKWTDEQRIDNCNVPIDKRGIRPRPTECVHVPTI